MTSIVIVGAAITSLLTRLVEDVLAVAFDGLDADEEPRAR
jgi:hypothetical protein